VHRQPGSRAEHPQEPPSACRPREHGPFCLPSSLHSPLFIGAGRVLPKALLPSCFYYFEPSASSWKTGCSCWDEAGLCRAQSPLASVWVGECKRESGNSKIGEGRDPRAPSHPSPCSRPCLPQLWKMFLGQFLKKSRKELLAALGQPLLPRILQTRFLEPCLQSVPERVPRRSHFQKGWPLCTPAMFNLLNISRRCVW